ncbi:MAG: DUF4184 family protein [Candidatus Thorarchaeota archaeon]
MKRSHIYYATYIEREIDLPLTLLHYPLALGISKLDKRLSLPALAVGGVIPDLEVLPLFLFFSEIVPDHLILHSLIGALTIGTAISIFSVRFLWPSVVSRIFGVDREELNEACQVNSWVVLSCMIGVLSHLLIDYPMHWYNPLLWPLVSPFDLVGPFVLLFTPWGPINGSAFSMANILTNVAMLSFFVYIIIRYKNKDLWRNLWLGGSKSATQGTHYPRE